MNTFNVTTLIKEISEKIGAAYEDQTLCQQYAWWIVEAISNSSKTQLIANQTVMLSPAQQNRLGEWLEKLITRNMPLQYLIGSVPFNDLEILVEPPTLIPRPETEQWCLYIIEHLQQLENKKITILDLATGSGCIALALAHHFPQAEVIGTDISATALSLAQKNAEHNKITNITFLHSDLFQSIPVGTTCDIIISNPPYISPDEWKQLDKTVTQWEDRAALIAPDSGLAIIKKIIKQAPHFIKQNNDMKQKNIPSVVIEIGHQQGEQVRNLMEQAGYNEILVCKDLEKKDRFVLGRVDYVADTTT